MGLNRGTVVCAAAVFGAAPGVGCVADAIGSAEQAIIGGELSDPGDYAATGALVRGLSYRCTATLIAPDVAITAGHCLVDEGFGDFGFTLDPDLTDGIEDLVPLVAHHQHPEFQADGEELTRLGQRNDVGVIILAEPIEGVAVEAIESGSEPAGVIELRGGMEMTVCGYGRDEWSTARTAGVKRDAVVLADLVDTWELQTASENPQPCRGDSGGPLFVETAGGRRLAGLVSRASGGSKMCDSGTIYTRVAPYADWIDEASLDRDSGCAVGGGARGAWVPALLLLLLALRSRRSLQATPAIALALLAGCAADRGLAGPHTGGGAGRAMEGSFAIRGMRLSDGERIRPAAAAPLADFATPAQRGWQAITDQLVQGRSAASLRRDPAGARRSRGSLEVRGEIRQGHKLPFAGVIFYPGAQPLEPVDFSRHEQLVLWARGDGRRYRVMLLSHGAGGPPPSQEFTAGPEWTELRLRLADFRGADLSGVTAILFGAGPPVGQFRLALDEVELR